MHKALGLIPQHHINQASWHRPAFRRRRQDDQKFIVRSSRPPSYKCVCTHTHTGSAGKF